MTIDASGLSHAARTRLGGLRVRAELQLAFHARDGRTRLSELAETGGWRVKFPAPHARHGEAVLLNSGGGIVGGDHVAVDVAVGDAADAVVSTATAERIYRASHGERALIDTTLRVTGAGRLEWLPQETIVFDGARLGRRIVADLSETACLLAAETVVFGRGASGEVMRSGAFRDRWRISRGGRLVLAEDTNLDGNVSALLARPGIGGGATAISLVVYAAPGAVDRIDDVRCALAEVAGTEAAASAWNGVLIVRVLARESHLTRAVLARLIPVLTGRAPPRVWQI